VAIPWTCGRDDGRILGRADAICHSALDGDLLYIDLDRMVPCLILSPLVFVVLAKATLMDLDLSAEFPSLFLTFPLEPHHFG